MADADSTKYHEKIGDLNAWSEIYDRVDFARLVRFFFFASRYLPEWRRCGISCLGTGFLSSTISTLKWDATSEVSLAWPERQHQVITRIAGGRVYGSPDGGDSAVEDDR